MTSSSARAGRHRAPSRWWHWEDEGGGEVVTLAQLLHRCQYRPPRYQLLQRRPDRVIEPRRITVIPRPRAAQD
ncbi:MAG: hypothetical protein ACRDQ4_13275 [Pseudonocardiaceae bacterium]